MSLEDTELKIGNTSFKGVYIAILFSLATTLGGGVWTASSLYSRLEAVEAGTVILVGTDKLKIVKETQELLDSKEKYQLVSTKQNPYGDGKACDRIIEFINKL